MTKRSAYTVRTERSAEKEGQVEAVRIPKRFWWLKRIALGVVVLIVALGVLRWWWGRHVDKILQAEIDRYVAAGQPVYPADFVPADLADEDNAALVLEQASAALAKLTAKQTDMLQNVYYGDPALIAMRAHDVAKLLEDASEARALVRKARSLPGADWGVRIQNPFVAWGFLNHSPRRMLARILSVAAIHAHQKGNDAEAVEAVRDMLALARHVDRDPSAISHLVASAISHRGADWVERYSWELRICDDAPATGVATRPARAAGAATRAQVTSLITELLDEGEPRRGFGFAWACYGERAAYLETADSLAGGKGVPALGPSPWGALGEVWAFVLGPLFQLEAVRMMQRETTWAEAGEKSAWPASRPPGPTVPGAALGLRRVAHSFSGISIGSCERRAHSHFRNLAFLRMAAIALAIRMYELDHGRRPQRLEALVRDYLSHLPEDPFRPSYSRIGYSPTAERAILSFTNLYTVDKQAYFRVGPREGLKDRLFFLDGDRPR